jgi:hypothetical protein
MGQVVMTGAAVPVVTVTSPGSLVLTAPAANAGTIYVGGPGVTVANGSPVPKGQSVPLAEVGGAGPLFAVGTAADLLGYFYGTKVS